MGTLYIYTTPKESTVQLTLDDGSILNGSEAMSANGRDDAHAVAVPDGAPAQGSVLSVSCEGYYDFAMRGITSSAPQFILDDIRLTEEAAPTPTPPDPGPGPTPPQPIATDPEGIINEVYATGQYDLATHDGCGQFTEACCTELHTRHSSMWGHIKKTGGQNQYNGHAVDAVYLLAGEGAGVYDIIHDSVSPNASPAYNWKDPGDPNLWYYPVTVAMGKEQLHYLLRSVKVARKAAPKAAGKAAGKAAPARGKR